MRQSTWWMPWLMVVVSGCGGKTIDVLESTDGPGTGGTSVAGQGQGGCGAPEECGAGQVCHPDGQCYATPLSCLPQACGPNGKGDCDCAWTCSDNSEYETRCRMTSEGLVTCNCGVDGEEFPWTCVVEDKTTDVCGMGEACCAFPRATSSPWPG